MYRHHSYSSRLVLTVLTLMAVFLVSFSPVLAHERQAFEIGDSTYLFIVGSLNEPIAVDDRTGVDLRVLRTDPANPTDREGSAVEPVLGLADTLQVELVAGGAQQVFPLQPAFNDPGAYRAIYYPTVPTTITYRFFGEIDGVTVDIPFTCNPAGHVGGEEDETRVELSDTVTRIFAAGDFGCPIARASNSFPEVSQSSYEVDAALATYQQQFRELQLLVYGFGAVIVVLLVILYRRTSIARDDT